MKQAGILLIAVAMLTGCAAAQQRAQTLQGAAESLANPDKTELHYDRAGSGVNFLWIKCGGIYCGAYTVDLPKEKQ